MPGLIENFYLNPDDRRIFLAVRGCRKTIKTPRSFFSALIVRLCLHLLAARSRCWLRLHVHKNRSHSILTTIIRAEEFLVNYSRIKISNVNSLSLPRGAPRPASVRQIVALLT